MNKMRAPLFSYLAIPSTKHFFFQSSSRGTKKIEKYKEKSSGFLLLHFSDERTYEVLSSHSTLLQNDFSFDTCVEKDEVLLKPDIRARIIAKSLIEKDMEVYKNRLERRLTKGDMNVSTDSLGFLNLTASCADDSVDESLEVGTEESPSCGGAENENMSPATRSVSLDEQVQLLRRIAEGQDIIVKELKKLRKNLKEDTSPARNLQPSSVFHNGVDLVKLGHNNMDSSRYAVKLGRALFTDDELTSNMLYPKRSTGRPPLSPDRSVLFKRAFLERFPDSEDLEVGINAVNYLGLDLKKGKRRRTE